MAGLWQWWYDLILAAADKGYPDVIHLPHSLISVANFRQWRRAEGEPDQWLYDLVASFWCHSQGGGCMSKGTLLGHHTIGIITNDKYLLFHALAYVASYWSPRDVVYRMLLQPRHPLRLICVTLDSLDAHTTAIALVDHARKAHPANPLLPYLASVLLYHGGSLFRWADTRLRGKPAKTFLSAPGTGMTKAVVVAFLWLRTRAEGGLARDRAMVAICTAMTCLDLLEEVFGFRNPLEDVHRPAAAFLQILRRSLSLGGDLEKHALVGQG